MPFPCTFPTETPIVNNNQGIPTVLVVGNEWSFPDTWCRVLTLDPALTQHPPTTTLNSNAHRIYIRSRCGPAETGSRMWNKLVIQEDGRTLGCFINNKGIKFFNNIKLCVLTFRCDFVCLFKVVSLCQNRSLHHVISNNTINENEDFFSVLVVKFNSISIQFNSIQLFVSFAIAHLKPFMGHF